jgi:hypothetical protein
VPRTTPLLPVLVVRPCGRFHLRKVLLLQSKNGTIYRLSSKPSRSQKTRKDQETVMNQRRPRKHRAQVQCKILDGILEQKGSLMNKKSSEIGRKSGI